MRALFVCTSGTARGPENHFVSMARSVAALGHSVEVVARPGEFIARELSRNDMQITGARFRNALDLWALSKVIRAARRFQPDWIVGALGHEYWPILAAARWTRTPAALFRHINAPLKRHTRWAVSRLAGRFIAVSASLRTNLILQGLPPARVQLLYNPVDLSQFRRDEALRRRMRNSLGIGENDVVVGYVGGLEESKGPFLLAAALDRAMVERPELRALWVVPESGHARLTQAIAPSLRPRHLLEGWKADVGPFYAAMDVLAVPSIWPEVFGRVATEAQACGVPVLGSQIGGIPEALIDGVTGSLVPPGDTAAWADALTAFAALPVERRQQMGRAGADFVAGRFSAERIGADFVRLLQHSSLGV